MLGLKKYQTAWTWLRKLRHAIVRPGRDLLTSGVEVDECYVGGLQEGLPGRLNLKKAPVVVAARGNGPGIGWTRTRQIVDASAAGAMPFVQDSVESGSIIHTDGWLGYLHLESKGCRHEVTFLRRRKKTPSELMPRAHRMISLLKHWVMGAHGGTGSHRHLDYYPDESTFRLDWRRSKGRGKPSFVSRNKGPPWIPYPMTGLCARPLKLVKSRTTICWGYLREGDNQLFKISGKTGHGSVLMFPSVQVVEEPLENGLLSSLPAEEHRLLFPKLERIHFSLGQVVYEPGAPLDYLYFPTSCVVSLLYTMEDGATAEVGLTGNDGAVGVALFLGGGTMPHRALVQIAGGAFRMKARLLQEEFARAGPLQHVLLRYAQALMIQISQTAVCNRLHPVEKRLCRWLLLSHDRVKSNELSMTQEFIANMLGGRRESVTVAAGRLQDAGLIHYSRGHIRILHRQGLEAAVCECYRVVKEEFNRLFIPVSKRDLRNRERACATDGSESV